MLGYILIHLKKLKLLKKKIEMNIFSFFFILKKFYATWVFISFKIEEFSRVDFFALLIRKKKETIDFNARFVDVLYGHSLSL